ncbi:MAG: hypothetical protein IJ794_16490 [Lachnospiraceae bacterium]|nr:hypothetical protein [Lachnospiraceae bacterium]
MSMSMIILIGCGVLIIAGTMLKVPGMMMLGFVGIAVDIVLIGLVSTGALPNWKF